MPKLRRLAMLLTPLVVVIGMLAPPSLAAVPGGFNDDLVVSVTDPTSLVFLSGGPDPAMLISSQTGVVHFREAGSPTTSPSPVLDLTSAIDDCDANEQGLLGMALSPDEATLFLFYTADLASGAGQDCENRVVSLPFTNGAPPVLGAETVLISGMPSDAGNHNGGDLQFGPDDNLYISVGEAAIPSNAQAKNNLQGKILRITPIGGIPEEGNAFTGIDSVRCNTGPAGQSQMCQEIFAYGLRNPYRIAVSPDTGEMFINDVGERSWEEVDRAKLGANYGWPRREGSCPRGVSKGDRCKPRSKPKGLTNPVVAYPHSGGCSVITGGAFVPAASDWPAKYRGDYLFADFGCNKIFWLDHPGKKQKRKTFGTNLDRVTHMAFGPDNNALFYLTHANGGAVRAIHLQT